MFEQRMTDQYTTTITTRCEHSLPSNALIKQTHPLCQQDSKYEDRQGSRKAQPAIEYKRCDLVQKLLVLPLHLGVLRRDGREGRVGRARVV